MQNRESGIDLLRCLALLLVVSLHMFLYNGFYTEVQSGAVMWAANSWRTICFTCVDIFLLITGYLKSAKPLNARYFTGLVPILTGYVITGIIVYTLLAASKGVLISPLVLAERIVQFANYAWYVEMYIGLILVSPLINLGLSKIQKPQHLVAICIVMFSLTALPNLLKYDIAPDYWTGLYPFTFYIIGAVIRRLQPKVPAAVCLVAVGISCVFSIFNMMQMDGKFNAGMTRGNGGFWITVIAVILFLSLYRVDLGKRCSKVLAFAAGGVFEGYLLSMLFDRTVYELVPFLHEPKFYLITWFAVSLPIFIVSLLGGKLIHFLAVKISKPIENTVYKLLKIPSR